MVAPPRRPRSRCAASELPVRSDATNAGITRPANGELTPIREFGRHDEAAVVAAPFRLKVRTQFDSQSSMTRSHWPFGGVWPLRTPNRPKIRANAGGQIELTQLGNLGSRVAQDGNYAT